MIQKFKLKQKMVKRVPSGKKIFHWIKKSKNYLKPGDIIYVQKILIIF